MSAGSIAPMLIKYREVRSDTGEAGSSPIRIAQFCAEDRREAVRECHAGVASQRAAVVTLFGSDGYDQGATTAEMHRLCLFAGIPVVSRTTAGEIGPAGYRERSLAVTSFEAGSFHAAAYIRTGLRQFDAGRAHTLAPVEISTPGAHSEHCLALLMSDGLSVREEEVAAV
ncbi:MULTISPECIES: FIST N-terminal domain-containing protein [Methylococcus]|uniref:FIST domain-containing protein n=1 Tax=Methylococcus capsulatus TaxID=414 RepID=A0ABZ2F608_METCP|nr:MULTISPECIES: FIST N-terminal domain-containing protein [Methylococcus]